MTCSCNGSLGSYTGVRTPYYSTYVPDSPFHAGSSGWMSAPVPGWGENPLLAGPRRLALGEGEAPRTSIDWKGDVVPAVISGTITAVLTGLVLYQLSRMGVRSA